MRNTNFLTILICLFLSYQSCEEIIEPDISDFQSKLVVESDFTTDHVLEVVVSRTRAVGTTIEQEIVTFATVEVFQGEELIEELILKECPNDLNEPYKYVSTDFTPKVGIQYTIKASAIGYTSVEASNYIPEATDIQSIIFDNTINIDNTNFATVDFSIALQFLDPMGVGNFYHIRLFQKLLEYETIEISDGGTISLDTITTGNIANADLNFGLTNDRLVYTKYWDGQSILLTDELVDGEALNLMISGNFIFDSNKYLPGEFSLEIRSVSEDYYLYFKSVTSQHNSSSNPFAEPDIIISNVENGGGFFGGYNPTLNSFDINGN